MIKLSDIESEAYFGFRRAQVEAMKTERLGVIHVSDIIKPCMRNVIYKKTMPDTGMTTEDFKSLYFGQAVHSNSMIAEPQHHEKFLAYNYVKDEPLPERTKCYLCDGMCGFASICFEDNRKKWNEK